eukprot:scaffold295719_cov33-Tisochrysis_lutea.AAC.1
MGMTSPGLSASVPLIGQRSAYALRRAPTAAHEAAHDSNMKAGLASHSPELAQPRQAAGSSWASFGACASQLSAHSVSMKV